MDDPARVIDERIHNIYKDSNVLYIQPIKPVWDNLHLKTQSRPYILAMTCETRVYVHGIKFPCKTSADNVTLDDISDSNKVDYLIRLNVLRMMLTHVANETNIFITIDEPDYNNGNINNAMIYVYRHRADPKPFTGWVANYEGSQFSFIYNKGKLINPPTNDYYEAIDAIIKFINLRKNRFTRWIVQ